MKKNRKNSNNINEQIPLTGKLEHLLGRVDVFKKMCRMLEMKRKQFLENHWKRYEKVIPRQQFLHLMMVRHSLPCNLNRIVQITGMTSAGASIFVDKMVKYGALERHEDVTDRRNVIISFTLHVQTVIERIDDRLDKYIFQYFSDCTPEELKTLEDASRLVCRVLDSKKESEE